MNSAFLFVSSGKKGVRFRKWTEKKKSERSIDRVQDSFHPSVYESPIHFSLTKFLELCYLMLTWVLFYALISTYLFVKFWGFCAGFFQSSLLLFCCVFNSYVKSIIYATLNKFFGEALCRCVLNSYVKSMIYAIWINSLVNRQFMLFESIL